MAVQGSSAGWGSAGLEPNTELAPPHQAIILNENQEFILFHETQCEPF